MLSKNLANLCELWAHHITAGESTGERPRGGLTASSCQSLLAISNWNFCTTAAELIVIAHESGVEAHPPHHRDQHLDEVG